MTGRWTLRVAMVLFYVWLAATVLGYILLIASRIL